MVEISGKIERTELIQKKARRKRKEKQSADGTNSEMVRLNSAISIITLNVNGLNTPVKSTNCQTT